MAEDLIAGVRRESGLTQEELARLSGTSRPTLSAYEHGRKSPSLNTARRIVGAAGFTLAAVPAVTFRTVTTSRGRPVVLPDGLWRIPVDLAFAETVLPLHLEWSVRDRRVDLANRSHRARVYEVVLSEGEAADLLAYVDGALLLDLWPELVLPREVRRLWESVVESALAGVVPVRGIS